MKNFLVPNKEEKGTANKPTKRTIKTDMRIAQKKAIRLHNECKTAVNYSLATPVKAKTLSNRSWILDTGSCVDLVKESDLTESDKRGIVDAERAERLLTANGPTHAYKEVLVDIQSCDASTYALVMENSPSVLSLGKLIEEKGFSFEWKFGSHPILVNPDGAIINIEVHDYVPMIAATALSCPVNQYGGISSSSVDAQAATTAEEMPHNTATAPAGSTGDRLRNAGDARIRKSLSPVHNIIHFPKDSRCDICSQCKKKTPHRRKHHAEEHGESDEELIADKSVTS